MRGPQIIRAPERPAAAAAPVARAAPNYEVQCAQVELLDRGLRAPIAGKDGPVYIAVRFECVTEIYVTVATAWIFYERYGQPWVVRVAATSPGWGDELVAAHARWMNGGVALPAAPGETHPQ